MLEERVASLEDGRAAVAAASGHAAQFLIFFTLMQPGDEFLASRNLYGGSLTQFGLSFKKLGWTCHFVDPTDPENFRTALTPKRKAIFIENLANPGGIVVDIEEGRGGRARRRHPADRRQHPGDALSVPADRMGRRHRLPFDDQVSLRPRPCAGRGRGRIGTVRLVAGRQRFPSLTEPEPAYHGLKFFENFGDFAFTTKARAVALRDFGPTLSPMNAFLTITGIETLHVRMDRHVENAQKVAEFLAVHPQRRLGFLCRA